MLYLLQEGHAVSFVIHCAEKRCAQLDGRAPSSTRLTSWRSFDSSWS